MNMNIFSLLLYKTYNDTESLKDMAPFQLIGGQSPEIQYFAAKKIADKVVDLENDLAAEKAKKETKPNVIYTGPITLSADMLHRLKEDQVGEISQQMGVPFDKAQTKADNVAALAAAFGN